MHRYDKTNGSFIISTRVLYVKIHYLIHVKMVPKAFYTTLPSKPINATAEISFVEFFLLGITYKNFSP